MGAHCQKLIKTIVLCSILLPNCVRADSSDVIHLYYGLEESERGVPACASSAQACSVLLQRYWRPAALVRLCRCPRRRPCPADRRADNHTLALNNRAHFKFCEPISHLPACKNKFVGLSVEMNQPNYSPDDFESLHHQNTLVSPPKVTAYCSCPQPHYWHIQSRNTTTGLYPTMHLYKCGPLGACKAGEFCGNVRADVESLYQQCSCPARHMCVHAGGLQLHDAEELLYSGKVRSAHCEPIDPTSQDSDEYLDEQ